MGPYGTEGQTDGRAKLGLTVVRPSLISTPKTCMDGRIHVDIFV